MGVLCCAVTSPVVPTSHSEIRGPMELLRGEKPDLMLIPCRANATILIIVLIMYSIVSGLIQFDLV